jgi:S-adenosylmethionine decarboxylase
MASRPAAARGLTGSTESSLGFGPHLIFDAFQCPGHRLDDLAAIYGLLDRLPERIRMNKIMPPYVLRYAGPLQAAEGLSGFVLIAESHVSIHTFPARGYVNVDIFSCEPFDVEDTLAQLRQEFLPKHVEWKVLDRGREFPKHLARSRALVARDRSVLARGSGLEASS